MKRIFREKMHVNGGATREVFLVPTQFMASKADRKLGFNPIRRAYIIRNGHVAPEYTSRPGPCPLPAAPCRA